MLVQVLNTTCLFVSNIYLYFKIELENNNWDMRLPIAIVIWRIKKIIWKIVRLVIYQILRLILQYLLTIYNPIHMNTYYISYHKKHFSNYWNKKGPFDAIKDIFKTFLCQEFQKVFWNRPKQWFTITSHSKMVWQQVVIM